MEGREVSTKNLTVSTSLRVSENIPLIVYEVESTYSKPITLDIVHPIPKGITPDQIVFHPNHQEWEVRSIVDLPSGIIWKSDRSTVIHFRKTVRQRSSIETYYALDVNNKKEVRSLLDKEIQTHVSTEENNLKRKSERDKRSKNREKLKENPVEQLVEHVDGYTFEHFIADLWEKQGWQTQVTNGSGDEGVDVVAITHVPYRIVSNIQVKHYTDTVISRPDIQQYSGLQQLMDVDTVAVVTSSSFSGPAEDWAKKTNVKLIDGDDLKRIIEKYDAHGLVRDYISK